ncbi:GIY-YIG nuclease family protein [Corynebacterium mendelii]|uniref:GIY-YIG nuclease family protein n=1 Tax=Corynebacterium mendelii TaxID=2765362 RepID=A0A939DZ47_9CORY|nr:GIY-YIG nuclease family protein [Corynebacterium mendelii]MBN9643914.1 GIY-YIG nuclease family protein [Corynebacterium mendelii]
MDSSGGVPVLRFYNWKMEPGVSLSAVIPEDITNCGIYVLVFADDSVYIGQTVSLKARIATHIRHWDDPISAVLFAPVAKDDLDQTERDVIARYVADGVKLRNIDLVTLPLRSTALDLLVDPQVQAEWLAGQTGPLVIGDRGKIAQQRERTRPKYEHLKQSDSYDDVVEAATAFIRTCIPWPHVTEGRLWTVTSMASTGKCRDWHRLLVVNINNVEVLVLGETLQEDGSWSADGFMNVALSPELENDPDLDAERADTYRSTGEVTRIWLADPRWVVELMEDPEIVHAARTLSIGLLRKGRGMFSRFHDYNVADDIFRRLDEYMPRDQYPAGR